MKETIETQVCTKCGLEKPLSEYYFRKDKNIYRRDCKDCMCSRSKKYYRANTEKAKAKSKAWVKANPEKAKAIYKTYRESNPEKVKEIKKRSRQKNPETSRAICAKRRAAKLNATPAWADLKKITQIYKDCPPGYHIDHVFPLQSPIMCGLHVENNLQYLPAKENISKGNRVTLEQQLNG